MFKIRKRKHTQIQNMDESRAIVYDFRRRLIKFEGYRPAEYRLNPALKEEVVKPMLDRHLAKLFAGEIDDANGDVLDRLIFSGVREGKTDLVRQRYEHMDMIARLTAGWESDYQDIRQLRDLREEELEELISDYRITCKLEEKSMNKGGTK